MLFRTPADGVNGVHVHFEVVGDVTADHGPLHKMDVIERVADPCRVMQILHTAFAIGPAFGVHHMDRGSCGTIVDAAAAEVEVVARIAGTKGNAPVGLCQRVFDKGPGEPDATIGALNGSGAGQIGHTGRRGIGQTDFFKRLKGCVVDPLYIGIRQRVVGATGHARPYGAQMGGKRSGAGSTTGSATAGTYGSLICHGSLPTGVRSRESGGIPLPGCTTCRAPAFSPDRPGHEGDDA